MILTITAIIFAILIISTGNTIYALIYLIGLFLTVASLLININIVYVGLLYIVVYVGAIAILFLFVVMIINVQDSQLFIHGKNYTKSIPLALILVCVFYENITKITEKTFVITEKSELWDGDISTITLVENLGLSLYTHGGLWLLLSALILLLCIVGPIVLTLHKK